MSELRHEALHVARPHGRLYVEVHGAGPPLVFAHGLGGNHMSWWQQVGHFMEAYTCITFAHRGFHPSDPVAGGPHPADYADDLAAILDALGIERFAMVGQSMGGWTATEFALRHQGRMQALVMACTTGSIAYRGFMTAERTALLDAWDARAAALRTQWLEQHILPACGAGLAARDPALHLLYGHIDRLNAGMDKPAILKRLYDNRTRPPGDLTALDLPILFVTGQDDVVIPTVGVETVAGFARRGRCVVVPDAGHSVYFEHAALFNDLVAKFLAEHGV